MKRLRNRNIRSKEATKDRYIRFTCIVMLLIILIIPLPVLAADAEFRMMHGEQDAIVVGTIKEITEEGCLIEKSHVIMCKAENTLNRQLPAEEIPDELLIEEVKYRFSYHKKSYPEVGDCIVISVDKKGKKWQQEWMAFEVSSTDISALEVLPPEDMTIGAYAWQLFIQSDGEKVNFAYEGDEILYLDGEVVFDRIENLEALSMDEVKADVSSAEGSTEEEQKINVIQAEDVEQVEELAEAGGIELTENEKVSISIIGGADGPTSIFLAGKLGTGFKITVTLIIVVSVIIVAWIIWRIVKKK